MKQVTMREKEWRKHICFGESDKFYKENQNFFLEFFHKENNVSKSKLLDLGCMDGEFSKKISMIIGVNKIYGIEIDKNAVKKAKEKGIIVKRADLNNRFPFPSEMFDIVSANQVLEHIWNTDNFFREINRVLKMGGGML